jgi:isochorismate pyruvate lyase
MRHGRALNSAAAPPRKARPPLRLKADGACASEATGPSRRETAVTKPPADCMTKDDVRAELDRIDQALLSLFAERHRYVTRMAEIKTDPHEAYDPTRIAAILSKQRKRAEELGLDEDQAELIWKTLIDWNVNYEKGIIVARRGSK